MVLNSNCLSRNWLKARSKILFPNIKVLAVRVLVANVFITILTCTRNLTRPLDTTSCRECPRATIFSLARQILHSLIFLFCCVICCLLLLVNLEISVKDGIAEIRTIEQPLLSEKNLKSAKRKSNASRKIWKGVHGSMMTVLKSNEKHRKIW